LRAAGSSPAGVQVPVPLSSSEIAGIDYRRQDDGLVRFFTTNIAPLLVVLGSVGGFVLMQQALRTGRAAIVSPIVALVTLVVPLPIGVAAFHEKMTATIAAGCLLVAVALLLLVTAAATPSRRATLEDGRGAADRSKT
jgi:cytochrome c biogenesis factor